MQMNRVIRSFIAVDLLLWGGWGFVMPIFALFVVDRIEGATAATVGITVAIYWIVRSIVQMGTAVFLDRHAGERDDFFALLCGLVLAGFSAMAFPLVATAKSLYLVSFLQGIAFGFYASAWSAIFSRHLDKEHYAFDWSLDHATLGTASAVAAVAGGIAVNAFGFNTVFIFAGLLSFGSALVVVLVPDLAFPRRPRSSGGEPLIRDHTPANTPY